MHEEILHQAVEKLQNSYGLQIKYRIRTSSEELNRTLDLSFEGKRTTWVFEIKKELRNYHLPRLFSVKERYDNLLLIAENISPGLREELRNQNIAYLDGAGNAFIKSENHFVCVDGRKKSVDTKSAPSRVFTRTGLKVVFLFLLDENLVNATHRQIANEAGIALGNIPRIMDGMRQSGYLLKIKQNQFKVTKKKELFQRWMVEYEEKLKPTLHSGCYRFTKDYNLLNWREIELDTAKTWWGGEPAADILTGFLKPELLTIYTEENHADLMKNYHLVPDRNGYIQIYKKFWHRQFKNGDTVPPLLVYTDLVNSGNARNIEAARLIHEQYLTHLI